MSSRGEDRPTPHLLLATDLVSRIAAQYDDQCRFCAWIWEKYCDLENRPSTPWCFQFQSIDGQARCIHLSFHCLEFLERDADKVRLCDVMYVRDIVPPNLGNLALPGTQMDPAHTSTSSRSVRSRKAPQGHVLQPPHLFVHPRVFYKLCMTYDHFQRLAAWMADVSKTFAEAAIFKPEYFDIYDVHLVRHRLTFDIYRLRYVHMYTDELIHLDVLYMEDRYLLAQRLPLRRTLIVGRFGVSSDQADGPR